MDTKSIKDKFIAGLPNEVTEKLTTPFHALIDETIESVVDGSTTIDNKKAATESEIMTAINYGVIARIEAFRTAIAAGRKLDADNVVINYRGTTLKIK